MSFVLNPLATRDAKEHALATFPQEACGVIVDGVYRRCTNVAAEPLANFKIAGSELLAVTAGGKLDAIVHSHPTANPAPSSNDMKAQISSRLPFVIVPTNGETCGDPVVWGENVAIAPLIGRSFVHAISDCFTAIRDFYRLDPDQAVAQGFDRPAFEPFTISEVPRDDGWWGEPGQPGEDLYAKGLAPNGFTPISHSEARAGDLFLCRIRSDQLNHAGVLATDQLIFHHLPGRLSRREPAGIWARSAQLWVRHTRTP